MLMWMRVPGDVIFSVGAVALAWFTLRLWAAQATALPEGMPDDDTALKAAGGCG